MNIYKKILSIAFLSTSLLMISGCKGRAFYNETYAETHHLELGVVQKEICKGMGQDQVAIALGAPNIVTYDKDQKETWIYDKIATEARQSSSSGLLLFLQTGANHVARRDVSQKTLTVVIKFNENKLVENVYYHSSKF